MMGKNLAEGIKIKSLVKRKSFGWIVAPDKSLLSAHLFFINIYLVIKVGRKIKPDEKQQKDHIGDLFERSGRKIFLQN